MSYSPVYTSEVMVEGLLQVTIDNSSIPTSTQLAQFMKDVEYGVIHRKLGSHTATDIYIDVPIGTEILRRYDWIYDAEHARLKIGINSGVLIPLIDIPTPIISITSLYKNDNDEASAPSWTALTQWDGTVASDFMLLKSGTKTLGYALWIYDDEPESGPNRLKMTYSYGFNVDLAILGDYCTYGASIKALMARMGTNEPDAMSMLEGDVLGRFMPRQYESRIKMFEAKMAYIEKTYFPQQSDFGADVF
jgi:hypothetical protein